MISTRFGQFSQDKVTKYLYRALKKNEDCRRESEEILRELLPPNTPITSSDVDRFILTTVIPECIADGSAKRIIEKFAEIMPESLQKLV